MAVPYNSLSGPGAKLQGLLSSGAVICEQSASDQVEKCNALPMLYTEKVNRRGGRGVQ